MYPMLASRAKEDEGGYSNPHRERGNYPSQQFLPTPVGLALTFALGRCPPALSAGVPRHPASLAQPLVLAGLRGLSASAASPLTAHTDNDPTGATGARPDTQGHISSRRTISDPEYHADHENDGDAWPNRVCGTQWRT